jgi:hypothetical protein
VTESDDRRAQTLRRLREAAAERRRIQADPKLRKAIIPHDKWADPLGVDMQGRPVPPPPSSRRRDRGA